MVCMKTNIEQTDLFLKRAFKKNSSYSFGDPVIMYEHGRTVRDFAMRITGSVECDRELLEVMALFHDIGKAYKADEQTLREKHAELGYEVTKDFLPDLELRDDQRQTLVDFLKGDMTSIEATVIKDADIIAFFADERLQQALKTWGDNNGLPNELQRKADKIRNLTFTSSEAIARPIYERFIEIWGLRA